MSSYWQKREIHSETFHRKDVSSVLAKKRELKSVSSESLGFSKDTRIFINESLCVFNRNLWYKAKILWKKKLIFGFWTTNGTVKIKRSETSNTVTISHIEDLKTLFENIDFENLE